ncbi:hypothetical protein F4553_004421 [Allocatelliglobosispora scoriae]|uniref:Uncharacterized protein n=1 Tax=Allocatelliglobosispora scoriae TaxID=643052 RepID=A0A841BW98_9ACTN|nr:hypothetical protein [Allocatelliglobosispora scoriae]MBB5871042.1 hypothetical protein [Allocatelliglobosispora scoriae]
MVPKKPIPEELRETPGRLRISVAEDADPLSSIVAPMLSPALDVVIALTEPVVHAVDPVEQPLLAVPLSHAMAVRGLVGEAFAATLEPVLFTEDDIVAPLRGTPHPEHTRPAKRIRAAKHAPVIRMAADADHRSAETQLPLTEPAGGRTPVDLGGPTAPAAAPGVPGAQAGVLPGAIQLAEPGETALRSAAHRAAERLVGDAPTSSPD